MAHVLGIPLIKGNSQAIVTANLSQTSASDTIIEGSFCSKVAGDIEAEVANMGVGSFYGIAMDINPCSQRLSVVREAECVLVRTDGTAPALGAQVLVGAAGLVSASGTISYNGEIMSALQTGVDGKTGAEVENCVLVSINTVQAAAAVVAVAASTAKTTAKK